MIKKIAALLTALTLTASSYASILSPDNMSGFYLSPQVGYGKANNGDSLKNLSTSSSEGGFTFRPSAGYMFNQYLGVVIGYMKFATNKYTINGVEQEVKNYAFDALATVALPLGNLTPALNRWDIFGKAGAAYTHTSGALSGSGYSPAYGAGIDFKINSKFALIASWEMIDGNKSSDHPDDYFYGAGFIVRFN